MQILAQMKLEFHEIHGTFQRRPGNFAVALNGVAVTNGKQSAVYGYRQEQRAACDQFFAVNIAAAKSRDEG